MAFFGSFSNPPCTNQQSEGVLDYLAHAHSASKNTNSSSGGDVNEAIDIRNALEAQTHSASSNTVSSFKQDLGSAIGQALTSAEAAFGGGILGLQPGPINSPSVTDLIDSIEKEFTDCVLALEKIKRGLSEVASLESTMYSNLGSAVTELSEIALNTLPGSLADDIMEDPDSPQAAKVQCMCKKAEQLFNEADCEAETALQKASRLSEQTIEIESKTFADLKRDIKTALGDIATKIRSLMAEIQHRVDDIRYLRNNILTPAEEELENLMQMYQHDQDIPSLLKWILGPLITPNATQILQRIIQERILMQQEYDKITQLQTKLAQTTEDVHRQQALQAAITLQEQIGVPQLTAEIGDFNQRGLKIKKTLGNLLLKVNMLGGLMEDTAEFSFSKDDWARGLLDICLDAILNDKLALGVRGALNCIISCYGEPLPPELQNLVDEIKQKLASLLPVEHLGPARAWPLM